MGHSAARKLRTGPPVCMSFMHSGHCLGGAQCPYRHESLHDAFSALVEQPLRREEQVRCETMPSHSRHPPIIHIHIMETARQESVLDTVGSKIKQDLRVCSARRRQIRQSALCHTCQMANAQRARPSTSQRGQAAAPITFQTPFPSVRNSSAQSKQGPSLQRIKLHCRA